MRLKGGGTVSVQATPEGARMVFRDLGPGVPADFLPVMFERFTRGESSRLDTQAAAGWGYPSPVVSVRHTEGLFRPRLGKREDW